MNVCYVCPGRLTITPNPYMSLSLPLLLLDSHRCYADVWCIFWFGPTHTLHKSSNAHGGPTKVSNASAESRLTTIHQQRSRVVSVAECITVFFPCPQHERVETRLHRLDQTLSTTRFHSALAVPSHSRALRSPSLSVWLE